MTVLRLAIQSLRNRWVTALLTVLAIALSVILLLGVEKIRNSARASFANTISGVDLIVGARAGHIQLLLYSVFHIGNATNNVTWRSYQDVISRNEVAWSVPISLGDSHRGFRVVGTSKDFFEHYRFRRTRQVSFASGGPFVDLFDAVVGSDVARELQYKLGQKIVVAHGIGALQTLDHADMPFRISGVLAKTGTPVDRSVFVSLEAIEAIHINWQDGAPRQGGIALTADQVRRLPLRPKAITAAMIGLKSRLALFQVQRFVNDYRREPLTAALPGLTLYEMWGLVGTAETALLSVSFMVVVTSLLGMMTMILATLNERRREIAILRSVGAGPRTVLGLLVSEAAILTTAGVLLGTALVYVGLVIGQPIIDRSYGIFLEIKPLSMIELGMLAAIIVGGIVAGLLPAWRAYRLSLADGMTVRT
ncbi:MAG: ABC transporter permease [Pseudomonadota bacterium]